MTTLIFIFRRSNNDLIMRMNIELVEALCGYQRVIKTLDDRDLVITAIPSELYYEKDNTCSNSSVMCLATEEAVWSYFYFTAPAKLDCLFGSSYSLI